MLIDSFSAACLLFFSSAAALLPAAFSIKNVANHTGSSTGGYDVLLEGCVIGGRLRTTAGLFSIFSQIIKHVGGPLAPIYQCEWVADLTELLELCRHADSTKYKSLMKPNMIGVCPCALTAVSAVHLQRTGNVLRLLASLVVCLI